MRAPPLTSASPTATSLLTIDLDALRSNYRTLRDKVAPAECAAVVKANAYGIGTEQAIRAFTREGCSTFFVATFEEAREVKGHAPSATVYVLDGFFPGTGEHFAKNDIRPVLSSLEEVRDWAGFCGTSGQKLAAALQFDTGMNRLGMSRVDAEELLGVPDLLDSFSPILLMSHLACADESESLMNEQQRADFLSMRDLFPAIPASFANSGGILSGPDFHFDLVRAGYALYGGKAVDAQPSLEPVVQLHARISQIHAGKAGATVGYGAAHKLERDTLIATISAGYADGLIRSMGADDNSPGFTAFIDGHTAPVLGRVSMDLITLDVTDIPEGSAKRGAWVEIIGQHTSVDALGEHAGTIGYEILTSLSRRAERRYLGLEELMQ